MRLTKLEHACVRLEKDGATLVIDPAAWSMPRALDGASAVLVTHEHFDHFDADGLRAALNCRPGPAALDERVGGQRVRRVQQRPGACGGRG